VLEERCSLLTRSLFPNSKRFSIAGEVREDVDPLHEFCSSIAITLSVIPRMDTHPTE
jgi:hypothetical protein